MTATPPSRPPRPTTLEIDLDAAAANVRAVRQMVGPGRKIFAVVKADGYGHGAAELGAVFVANGADALAVADLGEGIRLRRRGIVTPILVYIPTRCPRPRRTPSPTPSSRRSSTSTAHARTPRRPRGPVTCSSRSTSVSSGWVCRPSRR